MNADIKKIEDLSLNAWPSHQIELYDGWLLRFSYFYTHRTNSAEQIGPSTIPLDEKIKYCEERYTKWNTPAIFKISPLLSPSFDEMLAARGYEIQHKTHVMTKSLETAYPVNPSVKVELSSEISSKWIQGLFQLKGTTNLKHRQIVPSMYSAIPKDVICANILCDGKVAATGLGILDREYIGLYAIHVDEAYRGQHWGKAICTSILNKGMEMGASFAYLQVVSGNTPAKNLYTSLGFEYFYTYWFRVKE